MASSTYVLLILKSFYLSEQDMKFLPYKTLSSFSDHTTLKFVTNLISPFAACYHFCNSPLLMNNILNFYAKKSESYF